MQIDITFFLNIMFYATISLVLIFLRERVNWKEFIYVAKKWHLSTSGIVVLTWLCLTILITIVQYSMDFIRLLYFTGIDFLAELMSRFI